MSSTVVGPDPSQRLVYSNTAYDGLLLLSVYLPIPYLSSDAVASLKSRLWATLLSSSPDMSSPAAGHSGVSVTYSSTPAFLDSPLCSHLVSTLSSHFPLRNIPYTSAAASSTIQNLHVRLSPLSDELLKAKHKPETRHLVQANLLERPFAHLFIVGTADSDVYRTQIRKEIREWLETLKETPTLNAVPKTDEGSSSKDKDKDDDGLPEHLILYVTPPSGYNPGEVRPNSPGYFGQNGSSSSLTGPATPGTPKEAESATPKTGMARFLNTKSSEKDATGGVLDKLKTDFGGGKKAVK